MTIFAVWNSEESPIELPEGFSVHWYFDIDYSPFGSFAYDTDEETKDAEQREADKLNSGEYVALGCVIKDDVRGYEEDSLWGIVVRPNEKALVEAFAGLMELPDPVLSAQDAVDAAATALEKAQARLAREQAKASQA